MAAEGESILPRYRAFISYSHKDAAFGRRLHRRLEAYRVPGHLVGRVTARGPVPRRLTPIFRDREELPAAGDLTAEVRAALAESQCLIAICSPAAAASPWVAREVDIFRSLHPERPVLAALVAGDPAQAFPDALRRGLGDGATLEPLAADFRKGAQGAPVALLKLIAGMLGVGLDELVHRDTQRRMRNLSALTAASVAGVIVMGVLTGLAIEARREAERQRAEAESLVEYMLTDLRGRLKAVGRLDLLTAVGQRGLAYYADQKLERLSPASLERRARILHALGADDQQRGDLDAALAKFIEAKRATAPLLAAEPRNPERIFAHAQSEFWVGSIAYQRKDRAAAGNAFRAYLRLADQLVALQPDNVDYLREAGYAEGSLCALALSKPQDPPAALRACAAALSRMEAASRRLPGDRKIQIDLTNRRAWLADAFLAAHDRAHALEQRQAQEIMLQRLMAAEPRDVDLKYGWVVNQLALANLQLASGHRDAARSRLLGARSDIEFLIASDPTNRMWSDKGEEIAALLAKL
jgi:hypothetical protein